jgi:hypothetical protein
MVRVTGAGTVADAKTSQGSGTSFALSSVTATTAGTYLLQIVSRNVTGADTWTAPASATKRFDATATGSAVVGAGGDEIVGSGAAGTRTWTRTSTGGNRGALVAINPTGGGGGGGGAQRKVNVGGTATNATRYVNVGGTATAVTRQVH